MRDMVSAPFCGVDAREAREPGLFGVEAREAREPGRDGMGAPALSTESSLSAAPAQAWTTAASGCLPSFYHTIGLPLVGWLERQGSRALQK